MIAIGTSVRCGRMAYTVVRPGCATAWEECPHGVNAVTVVRDGKAATECVDGRSLVAT
jgi:hypothetical protein